MGSIGSAGSAGSGQGAGGAGGAGGGRGGAITDAGSGAGGGAGASRDGSAPGAQPQDAAGARDGAGAPAAAYPAGPYGFRVGEVMGNHTFTNRDGKALSLGELRERPGVKAILWSSGAEWCTACRGEVRKLKELFTSKGPEGLVILETLHESSNRTAANLDTLKRWEAMFNGIPYLLAVEKSPPYANHANLNPYVWIMNPRTMKILSLETHAEGDVVAAVNAALRAP